jgi:hypothetical protein
MPGSKIYRYLFLTSRPRLYLRNPPGNSSSLNRINSLHNDGQPLRSFKCRKVRDSARDAGSFEDDIQVTLSTSALGKELRYEALCYVWGNPNVTRPITLNEHTFEVTTNLEAAIRHLRFQDRGRVFWIDAIFVNQTDNNERSSQVLLMRDIYTHCERCIAWLGEEDDNTKDAISFLKFFAQDKHLHEWDGFSDVKRNVDQLTAEIWDKLFEERSQIFKPMLYLMARPW